jgi:glutathione S-transferase
MTGMVLHWSPRSPYVRRVMVAAHEKGLADSFERKRTVVSNFFEPPPEIVTDNPLGKIPTLVLPDGTVLYDSRVICMYFDSIGRLGPRLYPAPGPASFVALRDEALGIGFTDLLITLIVERNRAENLRSEEMRKVIIQKCQNSLAGMTRMVAELKARPFDVGHLSIGCALAYTDFRFHELNWRKHNPALANWYDTIAARPSFSATAFVDEDSGPKN